MNFNPLSIAQAFANPATLMQLAAGPAGWATLAAQTMFSAVGQQVIQNIGQQLGLPSSVINMAQSAFAQSSGLGGFGQQGISGAVSSLAEQFGLSPSQQGSLERAGNNFADKLGELMLGQIREGNTEESQSASQGGSGSQSLLMKIAVALGKLLDKKMTEMAKLSDQIGKVGSGKDSQSKLGELTGKLQGLSQEVSMLSNALTNTIKTIGEANTTLARKG
jgi:hypothetical protein